jgi:hypothetical protein
MNTLGFTGRTHLLTLHASLDIRQRWFPGNVLQNHAAAVRFDRTCCLLEDRIDVPHDFQPPEAGGATINARSGGWGQLRGAMPAGQVCAASKLVALRYDLPTSISVELLAAGKRVTPMRFALSPVLRDIFGLSTPHDEHLLAGADEESLQALGVSQPVLARFQRDVAVLCPNLVREAQVGLGRR